MPKLSIREITSKVPIHTSPPYIKHFLIRDCPIQAKDEETALKQKKQTQSGSALVLHSYDGSSKLSFQKTDRC